MATIKINVKWGKENVPCEIKPGQTPDQLFDDLQNKTGVPVARQKLMARGAWRGVLKSGMAMDLKDGQNVTLMGTADVLLKPKVETKFLEDMKVGNRAENDLQRDVAAATPPTRLVSVPRRKRTRPRVV